MKWDKHFLERIKGNIIKWWQQVRLPALHINNNNWSKNHKKNRNIETDYEEKEAQLEAAEVETVQPEPTSDKNSNAVAGGNADEVLNRILHEKEWEIEKIRKQVQDEERVASIMNANKVDVNAFIEEGRSALKDKERSAAEEEYMRKAQEIMDRLNREAEEDEAKKQAEIEAAKQIAKETFG